MARATAARTGKARRAKVKKPAEKPATCGLFGGIGWVGGWVGGWGGLSGFGCRWVGGFWLGGWEGFLGGGEMNGSLVGEWFSGWMSERQCG